MRDTPSSPPTTTPGSPGSIGMPGSPTTSPPGSPGSAGPFSPRARRSPNFLSSDSEAEAPSIENEKSVTAGHFSAATLHNLQKVLQQQAKLTSLVGISHQKVLVAEALSKIPDINVGSIEQDGIGKTLSFITDGRDVKLELKKQIGQGNNGVVHLATLQSTSENVVVKSIAVYNKEIYKSTKKLVIDSELISRIIREHKNMNAAGLASKLIYDPVSMNLYVTMPQYPGITAKKMISGKDGLVAQLKNKIARGEQRAALIIMRDMLLIFKGALQALNDFHVKTALNGQELVHGDAWLDNFMVNKRADESFEVNLIDYGACCQAGITGQEYLDQKLQIGVGDFHTAPEIPSQANKKSRELQAMISEKSDLHAVAASFIFEGFLDVFSADRVKTGERSDGLSVAAQEFMLWAMTVACNSDWFYKMLGEPITEQAQELRGSVTSTGSVDKRLELVEAIQQVEEFITRVDDLSQQSSANLERSARYVDIDKATKKVNIADKVQKYERAIRPKDSDEHHHKHPH